MAIQAGLHTPGAVSATGLILNTVPQGIPAVIVPDALGGIYLNGVQILAGIGGAPVIINNLQNGNVLTYYSNAPLLPITAGTGDTIDIVTYGNTAYAINTDALIYKIVNGVVVGSVGTGSSPFGDTLAISPDGRTLYVGTNNDGNILVLNTATLTFGTPIVTNPAAGQYTIDLAMAPDGTLYSVNVDAFVYKIRSGAVVSSTATGASPFGDTLAVSPNSGIVYVGTNNDGNILVLNTATMVFGTPIVTNPAAGQFIIDITVSSNGTLYAFNLDTYVYKIVSGSVVGSATIGASPYGVTLALSLNGNTLYMGTGNDGNVLTVSTSVMTFGVPIATSATAVSVVSVLQSNGNIYTGDTASNKIYVAAPYGAWTNK
jgi:WD40 repeat protein